MKNLLKYGLVIVLAMIASTGLLWADGKNVSEEKAISAIAKPIEAKADSSTMCPQEEVVGARAEINDASKIADVPNSKGEENTKPQLESRGKELVGLVLLIVIVAFLLFAIIAIIVSINNKKNSGSQGANNNECSKTKDTSTQDPNLEQKEEQTWMEKLYDTIYNSWLSHDRLRRVSVDIMYLMSIAILVFITIINIHFFCPSWFHSLSLEKFGQLGDFFGGFIGAFIALLVAIYAIRTYKLEQQLQREASLEGMLATMLELHKQNVAEIKIKKTGKKDEYVEGRDAFEQMYGELKYIYSKVEKAIQKEVDNDPDKYEDYCDETKQKKLAHILSFGYFFYNASRYTIVSNEGVLKDLSEKASLKIPAMYRQLNRHIVLGHYYRHLFNMVNYIEKNEHIKNYDKKEKYVKIIRSQLSDYEEILLYYNSLSHLGVDWNKSPREPQEEMHKENMSLICKYRLLKNCPSYIQYFGIEPKETYIEEIKVWKEEEKEMFFETDLEGLEPIIDRMLG